MRKRKKKQRKKLEQFPGFEQLMPLINEECHEDVNRMLCLLRPEWRDVVCQAAIAYVKTGTVTQFEDSRVLTQVFEKVTLRITC